MPGRTSPQAGEIHDKTMGLEPEEREKSRETIARRVAQFDATVVDRIREMRAEGATYREIAAALQVAGLPPPGRRAYWHPAGWSHVAVMRIAKRNGIA